MISEKHISILETDLRSGRDVAIPAALGDWLAKPKRSVIATLESDSGQSFTTENPATGESLSSLTAADASEVYAAVRAARQAFETGPWPKMPIAERAGYLRRLADLIDMHRAPLALLESLDTGKPIGETLDGDVPRAALNLRFFADFAEKEDRPVLYESGDFVHKTLREPLGVVALITPWNLPLYLETWKLAPALVMGNSVLLKPSELTPLTASYLAELVAECDFPAGVFQLLHGFGENSVGEWLTSCPGIDAISFTGETSTGRAIMKSAAVGPTRVSFELGGKGASVVFKSADIAAAVKETVRAGFRNQGQICLASPRVFVEDSVFERFTEDFVSQVKAIRIGSPQNFVTQMGSLISRGHRDKVQDYVRLVTSPGQILCGGTIPPGYERGAYFAPTVVTGLSSDHRVAREEIFGPVVSLHRFSSEDELVGEVNSTPYGLSASVWSGNSEQAQRTAARLRTGLVWINSWFVRDLRVPFGGQKRSGLGREGGTHSLDFFSEWKSICTPRR